MLKVLLALFALAVVIEHGQAINCYGRTSSSSSGNGSTFTCSATNAFCYLYYSVGTSYSIAGCATSVSCTNCYLQVCQTDYCNSVTPSSISCYTRSSASTSTNGTMTTCATGVTSCYTQYSFNGNAGCGNCSNSISKYYTCRECSSNYCNTLSPSSITCYTRSSSTSYYTDGTSTTCPTGTSTCYTHSDGESGCGGCTSDSTSSFSCRTCSSSLCNTRSASTTSSSTRRSDASASAGVSAKLLFIAGGMLLMSLWYRG